MATLDRQTPSPDTLLCKHWSSFVSAAELRLVDYSSGNREIELFSNTHAIKASREEMHVYGPFPDLEDRSLVVCHICNQVVTPHGIHTHYGSRAVVSVSQ